jgi:hypothetical protein
MRDFRSPLAAAVLGAAVLAATPAFAFHCPQEMAKGLWSMLGDEGQAAACSSVA